MEKEAPSKMLRMSDFGVMIANSNAKKCMKGWRDDFLLQSRLSSRIIGIKMYS